MLQKLVSHFSIQIIRCGRGYPIMAYKDYSPFDLFIIAES